MKRVLIAAVLGLACSGPAAATGVLNCSITDKNFTLTFEATISHGLGGGIVAVAGELSPNIKNPAAALGTMALEAGDVKQYWFDGRTLKLLLYRESAGEPHLTVDLVIETTKLGRSETDYAGPYRATVFSVGAGAGGEGKTTVLKGRAECAAG